MMETVVGHYRGRQADGPLGEGVAHTTLQVIPAQPDFPSVLSLFLAAA